MKNKTILALEIIGRVLVVFGAGHSLDSLAKGLTFTIFVGTILLFWTLLPINKLMMSESDIE